MERAEARRGLWLDEVYSLMLSRGEGYAHRALATGVALDECPSRLVEAAPQLNLAGLWRGQRLDSHPPLYFAALHVWRWWLGGELAVARGFSLATFAGAVVATAFAARAMGWGRVGSLLACIVLAMSMPMLWYAAEVRGYAMGVLAAVVVLAAVTRLAQKPGVVRVAVCAAALLAAALTHYFLLGVVSGALVGATVVGDPRARRALGTSAALALAVYGGVWGSGLASQWAVREGYLGWIAGWGELPLWLMGVLLVGAVSRVLGAPADLTGAVAGGAIVVAMTAAAWVVRRTRRPVGAMETDGRPGRVNERPEGLTGRSPVAWAVLLGSLSGAVLLPGLMDLALGTVHLFQTRYVLFAIAPVALAAGGFWAAGSAWRWLAAGLLAVCLLGQNENWTTESDWRSVAMAAKRWLDGQHPGPEKETRSATATSGTSDGTPQRYRTGVAFAVAAADPTSRRTDVETDVRLLAVLVTAQPGAGGAAGHTFALGAQAMLLLEAPATDAMFTGQSGTPDRWVLISAWRLMDPATSFPGWVVRHAEVWPEMNARMWVLERGPRSSGG